MPPNNICLRLKGSVSCLKFWNPAFYCVLQIPKPWFYDLSRLFINAEHNYSYWWNNCFVFTIARWVINPYMMGGNFQILDHMQYVIWKCSGCLFTCGSKSINTAVCFLFVGLFVGNFEICKQNLYWGKAGVKKLYSGVQQADHVYTECTEQLYKHRCLSVRLSVCLSVCLFICPKFCIQVNVTSTEARQAASSCTVDYNEVLPTQRKWRPMPTQICQPHSATPVRESY